MALRDFKTVIDSSILPTYKFLKIWNRLNNWSMAVVRLQMFISIFFFK